MPKPSHGLPPPRERANGAHGRPFGRLRSGLFVGKALDLQAGGRRMSGALPLPLGRWVSCGASWPGHPAAPPRPMHALVLPTAACQAAVGAELLPFLALRAAHSPSSHSRPCCAAGSSPPAPSHSTPHARTLTYPPGKVGLHLKDFLIPAHGSCLATQTLLPDRWNDHRSTICCSSSPRCRSCCSREQWGAAERHPAAE